MYINIYMYVYMYMHMCMYMYMHDLEGQPGDGVEVGAT